MSKEIDVTSKKSKKNHAMGLNVTLAQHFSYFFSIHHFYKKKIKCICDFDKHRGLSDKSTLTVTNTNNNS